MTEKIMNWKRYGRKRSCPF